MAEPCASTSLSCIAASTMGIGPPPASRRYDASASAPAGLWAASISNSPAGSAEPLQPAPAIARRQRQRHRVAGATAGPPASHGFSARARRWPRCRPDAAPSSDRSQRRRSGHSGAARLTLARGRRASSSCSTAPSRRHERCAHVAGGRVTTAEPPRGTSPDHQRHAGLGDAGLLAGDRAPGSCPGAARGRRRST